MGVLMATQEMLHARGYRVAAFGRSAQALEVLRADSTVFDLVITDLRMPGESGLEVARAVREVDPALPVILITGFVEDASAQRADELGISAVLEKPVDAEELCLAIAKVLRASRRS
jgi:two-component system, cell cycle sensor histidine kinase and response regulator CckA